jgi:hypothetical protein
VRQSIGLSRVVEAPLLCRTPLLDPLSLDPLRKAKPRNTPTTSGLLRLG